MIDLSILICSLEKRQRSLKVLLDKINEKRTKNVEVIINVDNGEKSVGEKRNELLEKSQGRYVVFIDDDDSISDKYLPMIMNCIPMDPDVICFNVLMVTDNKTRERARLSIKYDKWFTETDPNNQGLRIFYRCPNHITPVKREYAIQVGFEDKDSGEDRDYSYGLKKYLKKEMIIDEELYIYNFNTKKEIIAPSLHSIGKLCKTDKAHHIYNGKSFLQVYEKYLIRMRYNNNNILEIGVYNGASLRTWKRYFKESNIYGLDINPDCKTHEEENIKIFIGSQDSETTLDEIINEAGSFDFILDDGSHVNKMTMKTFEYLINHLNPGGIYIIEDLHCSYIDLDKEDVRNQWPGMKFNDSKESFKNVRVDMEIFFLKLLKQIDGQEGPISSIHFYSNTCVMVKK